MASADQIKALLKSHAEGDEERFYSIALQIAAQAALHGHSRIAEEMRDIVDSVKSRTVRKAESRGELGGLLSVADSEIRLSQMTLAENIKASLSRVLLEQRQRHKLRAHGLAPRNKLLLVGPPGSGKTMTAFALAAEMGVPVCTIQLDALITKFMGETAAKLRTIFDEIRRVRGVYFFDEFDAIGGRRTSTNDVGEIRRVLNSFLQFIEQNHHDSVIISATNHPELLDRALFRRFDDVIEYSYPTPQLALGVLKERLSTVESEQLKMSEIVIAARGLSFADLVKACEDSIKESVLSGKPITSEFLTRSLQARKGLGLMAKNGRIQRKS